ncbi:AAA family ATPase [Actinoplanes sp. TBRC 11911]|uniref:ATP-binding protein n=1 Tax=Actinoplanes sp. TBRC 11911 TaxID=2729386 RepID=UPI00145DA6BB|nr:LuxR family transcriptional regulator [Actinoplanes sp. TBRC 11911]NMO56853.1 AAA family ATPase [Actinoplanes sp. TBRC 11911]
MTESSVQAAPATPRIVGRDAELRMILQTVRAAKRGRGGSLLIVGDPGIGKTILLDAAGDMAMADGLLVLRAAGVEFEADISFAGLNQMLLPVMRDTALTTGPQSEALRVALGLATGPAPSFLAVSNAILALLGELAQAAPVLLVVDDLPWLDRPSAIVLGLVARRLSGLQAGLVIGQRTGETSFFEHSGMPQLMLHPLDDAASDELLKQRFPDLSPRARRRIVDEAQGNPLALTELPAVRSGASTSSLPMSRKLQEVFASRITDLPAATRSLLLMAALSGPADLRVIVGSTADLENLDPALRDGIVSLDPQSGRLSFRHPLSRLAVVELSTPGERNRAHRSLADRSPDPVRRAFHLAESTVEPDDAIAGVVERAAHIVLARGDAVSSVETLTRAAELSVDQAARVRRLAEAATIGAELIGELGNAEELLESASRSADDPSGSLQLSTAAASLLFNRESVVDTPHRLLTLALQAHADSADRETLSDALYLLIVVCYFGGRAELWPPYYAAVKYLGDDVPTSLVLLSAMHGDPARLGATTVHLLEDELHRLPRMENPAEIMRLTVASVFADRIGEGREALLRVVEDGRRGGATAAAINAIVNLSVDAWKHGRWDEAEQLVAEGSELSSGHGYLRYTWCFEGYVLNLVRAARGDDKAVSGAEELDQWGRARGALVVSAMAYEIYCMAALTRGDFESAYQAAVEISPAGVLRSHMPHALWVVFDLVESAMRTGREQEARAHVAAAREAQLDGLSSRLALSLHGAEALAADDADKVRLFERALAGPDVEQWPFLLGRVRLCYGETLRRRRQITEARRQLAMAQEIFGRLGAVPWSRRAENELRATGMAGSEPRATLTAQEREIAQLAATGMTNKEIGERLALSPRTVAAHLYRAFPKLGITSRAALRDALSALHSG